jgi:hypothetical protein
MARPTSEMRTLPTTQPPRKSAIPARSTASIPARSTASIPARNTASVPAPSNNRRNLIEADDEVEIITRRSGALHEDGQRPRRRMHWLFYVGLAMLAMTLIWGGVNYVTYQWQIFQDDLHHGRPRTVHLDAVVGHNDSITNKSHFIAINLNRQIQVIEYPGGDSARAKVYLGPTLLGADQDLAVPKLSFSDVNRDGKPDMIIMIQDSRYILINENGGFRAIRADENANLQI